MNNLSLIKSASFGNVECDIYRRGKDLYMTIDQLAQALEYASRDAVEKIVSRNPYLKNSEFSVTDKLSATDGKRYNTRVFTEDGIYEVTMLAKTEKAKEFRCWVRGILKALRSGQAKLVGMSEYQRLVTTARMANAKAREASLLLKIADRCKIGEYVQVLHSKATEILTGQALIPLPEAPERTYSAQDIGKLFGISKQMVGRLANAHDLKTAQFGKLFYDKAKYSDKQVESWRYYASVIPQFEKILGMKASA